MEEVDINGVWIRRLSWLLLIAASLNLFVSFSPLKSFWLDETITAWVVSGSWSDVTERVFSFQATSPLYYWMGKLFFAVFGENELALRSLSILAAGATLILVYRIARRWLSEPAAIAALLFLVAHSEFDRATLSARPYSMALFFSVAAAEFLLRWLNTGRRVSLLLSAALSLLAFYAHYLLAFSLATVFVAATLLGKRDSNCRLRDFALALVIGGIGALPGVLHLRHLSSFGDEYSFSAPITAVRVLGSFMPLELIVSAVMTAALLMVFSPGLRWSSGSLDRAGLLRAILWTSVPPVTVIVLSLFSGNSLLVGRYYLFGAIGGALLGGFLVQSIVKNRHRYIFCLCFSVISLFLHRWEMEDWKGAAAYLNQHATQNSIVLLHSGIREAEYDRWLLDKGSESYLTTPFHVYSVPASVVSAPMEIAEHLQYKKQLLEKLQSSSDKIFLVNLRSPREFKSETASSFMQRYTEFLQSEGYVAGRNYWRNGLMEIQDVEKR